MSDVKVSIEGILMFCDETACHLDIGDGYTIKKVHLKDMNNKDSILNKNDEISYEYKESILRDSNNEISFIVLKKEDIISGEFSTVHSKSLGFGKFPANLSGPYVPAEFKDLENKQFMRTEYSVLPQEETDVRRELKSYSEKQHKYLNNIVNILHLIDEGNIGFKDIFFTFDLGFNKTQTVHNLFVTRNFLDTRVFIVDLNKCEKIAERSQSKEFMLLKDVIEQFNWALEQVDLATKLVLFTTTIEMILIRSDEKRKTRRLSTRIAVLFYQDKEMLEQSSERTRYFYKKRSSYLHSGVISSITSEGVLELEKDTRVLLNLVWKKATLYLQKNKKGKFVNFKEQLLDELDIEVRKAIENKNLRYTKGSYNGRKMSKKKPSPPPRI